MRACNQGRRRGSTVSHRDTVGCTLRLVDPTCSCWPTLNLILAAVLGPAVCRLRRRAGASPGGLDAQRLFGAANVDDVTPSLRMVGVLAEMALGSAEAPHPKDGEVAVAAAAAQESAAGAPVGGDFTPPPRIDRFPPIRAGGGGGGGGRTFKSVGGG